MHFLNVQGWFMENGDGFMVEVAYATPKSQLILEYLARATSTVEEAIRGCGIMERFLSKNRSGFNTGKRQGARG